MPNPEIYRTKKTISSLKLLMMGINKPSEDKNSKITTLSSLNQKMVALNTLIRPLVSKVLSLLPRRVIQRLKREEILISLTALVTNKVLLQSKN